MWLVHAPTSCLLCPLRIGALNGTSSWQAGRTRGGEAPYSEFVPCSIAGPTCCLWQHSTTLLLMCVTMTS